MDTANSMQWVITRVNTLRPGQDGRHFANDSFTCIFVNENCCILIEFSLKYVCKGPIDNNQALVKILAWRRSGDKPLSEPMMGKFGAHICVSRPQWVKYQLVIHFMIKESWLDKTLLGHFYWNDIYVIISWVCVQTTTSSANRNTDV